MSFVFKAEVSWGRRTGRWRLLWSLLLLFSLPLLAAGDPAWRIGVLAVDGKKSCETAWGPLAAYLSGKVPGRGFEIIPLDYQEIDLAVKQKQVDFLVCNPAIFESLAREYELRELASMKIGADQRGVYADSGSVVICKTAAADLQLLQDLKGRTVAAVAPLSLGGCLAAKYELEGCDVRSSEVQWIYSGSPEKVFRAVLGGEVEAGVIPIGFLERMKQEQRFRKDDLRVVNRLPSPQGLVGFARSSAVYPPWPIGATSKVPDEAANAIVGALLAQSPDSAELKAIGIAGWVAPISCRRLGRLLEQLRLGPYANLDKPVDFATLVQQNLGFVALLVLALLALGAMGLQLFRMVRKQAESDGKREAVEAMLAESDRRHRTLLEMTDEGVITLNVNDTVASLNPAAANLLGWTLRELAGQSFHDVIHHSGSDGTATSAEQCPLLQTVKNGKECRLQNEWLWRRDGTPLLADITARPLFREGDVVGSVLHFRDVTALRQSERGLAEAEERWQVLFDYAMEPLLLLDASGVCLAANHVATEVFQNGSPEAFHLHHLAELSALQQEGGEQAMDAFNARLIRALEHGSDQFLWTCRRPDGTEFLAEMTLVRITFHGSDAYLVKLALPSS